MKRVGFAALVIVTGLGALVAVAAAAEDTETLLDGKVRAGSVLVVGVDETIEDDLYVFASTVTVEADIPGDLIVFSSDLTVAGDVGGDVLIGSGAVRILGAVAGDVRAGAGTLELRGNIGEDVAAGSGVLTIAGDVGGDVLFGAGQATISGTVEGDVEGSTGVYSLQGTVRGNENVRIDEPSDFEPVQRPAWLRGLSRFVSLVLVGAALLAWFRRPTQSAMEELTERPASALLWGAVAWVATVLTAVGGIIVAIILGLVFGFARLEELVGLAVFSGLMVTLLALFALVLVTVFVGPVISGTALGQAIVRREDDVPWWSLLAGVAIFVALWLIPVVGGLVLALAVAFGLGGLVLVWRASREPTRSIHVGNGPALP